MPYLPEKEKRPWRKPRQAFQRNTDNSLYQSWKWKKFSKAYKNKPENALCRQCEAEGRVTASEVTDHIVRVEDGGAVWDTRNLQPLCRSCHNSKSGKEAHGYKEMKPKTNNNE